VRDKRLPLDVPQAGVRCSGALPTPPGWRGGPRADRADARASSALAMRVSRHTVLRILLSPQVTPPCVLRMLGVDDFALPKRHRFTTILIDAETRERIEVLPKRSDDAPWIGFAHRGVERACQDGSSAYTEAIPPCPAGCGAGRRPLAHLAHPR
jgi:hypothetical protein